MRLSWNEIRARAAVFAEEWKGASYERGQTQTFYNEFFEVFGVPRKKVAIFEEPVKGLADNKRGFMDLFWKGTLLVEQKSAGRDLTKAKRQAFDYLPGIKNDKDLPRFILLCDFQSFELYDLETRKDWKFGLYDLPKNVQAFSFIFGGVQREFKDEDPVNIKASELMGELHDALKAGGYEGHDLERFLVRLVFCLFADDTGIFAPKGILTDYIEQRTSPDGTDLGPKLANLFEVLNTAEDKRQKTLDEDLKQFPYVNGDLFRERLPLPSFDSRMRRLLLDACDFDWSLISPAIFGALFQSVMDKKKRRAIGAHYTSEQNIMKVIGPLFLDDLKAELARLKARKDTSRDKALAAFQEKLSEINCFDPACGCGNFLVIAYRELRALENQAILARGSQFTGALPKVDVNQFYGIEIEEFPARIGEVAMWMMDHVMNMQLSDALGVHLPRIPLKASPTICHADALEVDWSSVLPAEQCSYVFGNPPFGGFVFRDAQRQKQMLDIVKLGTAGGRIDFVAAWFFKAGEYVQHSRAAIAFVTSNSMTQGEQVPQIWPALFQRYGLEIAFAHRTFAWGSEARGKAHVHVVIIGLCRRESAPQLKRLFDYPDINGEPTETTVKAISAYLFDATQLSVCPQSP
jgi:N-6 DNA Methylase